MLTYTIILKITNVPLFGTKKLFFYFLFLSDEGPMLEPLDYTIRIGSSPTILYFDLYLYSAYAAHIRLFCKL